MKSFLAVMSVLILAGCASSDVNVPSKTQCLVKVASAEIAITKAYESAAASLKAHFIDKETAKTALKSIDTANSAVDAAAKLCAVDEPAALDYIAAAGAFLVDSNKILGD